ncbi:unnamed protein product, partial [Polarella glacialis]
MASSGWKWELPSRWRKFELFRREALLDTRYGKSSVPPIAGKRSTSTPNHGQLSTCS